MLTCHTNIYEERCFSSFKENSTCKGAMFGPTADTDTKEWSSYVVLGQNAAHFNTIFQKCSWSEARISSREDS